MATKKDLLNAVDRLNNKYCKKSRNKLCITSAYGGYEVGLTGKTTKTGKYYKDSLGSSVVNVTVGHNNATKTLNDLYESDSRGWLKSKIKHYNKKR